MFNQFKAFEEWQTSMSVVGKEEAKSTSTSTSTSTAPKPVEKPSPPPPAVASAAVSKAVEKEVRLAFLCHSFVECLFDTYATVLSGKLRWRYITINQTNYECICILINRRLEKSD
jgi:hypothetical protein